MTDYGAYYHDKFILGEKDLVFDMSRETIKGSAAYASRRNEDAYNPDFYAQDNEAPSSSCQPSHHQPEAIESVKDVFQMTTPWHDDCHLPQTNHTSSNGDDSRSVLEWVIEATSQSLPPPTEHGSIHDLTLTSLSDEQRMMLALEPSSLVALSKTDESYLSEGDETFFEGRRFFFVDPSIETQ